MEFELSFILFFTITLFMYVTLDMCVCVHMLFSNLSQDLYLCIYHLAILFLHTYLCVALYFLGFSA